ncbi:hypothetical protein HZA73_08965 [candidate division TA06 bacterium]|nr:hypothetical protein [candidate division TA06 bacterium]
MKLKTQCIIIALALALLNNAAHGTFRSPYELREAKFSKKPKLDQWCTLKIKVVCEGRPTADSLPLKINSPGIQTDLPGDSLPVWRDIKEGGVYRAEFRIRPYFYGSSLLTVSIANGGVFIGINDKGKSSFAGTSAELNKLLGPWQVSGYNIYGQPVHDLSEEQERKKEEILSGYLKDGIKYIQSKKGILKSIRGGGNILRYDFYLSPLPEWGKKSKLKIKLVTRKKEQPKVEVYKTSDMKCFINIDTLAQLPFVKGKEGIFTSELVVMPNKENGLHTWFNFIYGEKDTIERGLDINFDEQGKIKLNIW